MLDPGQPRKLVYQGNVRTDLKLLEVDANLLEEILAEGYSSGVQPALTSPTYRF
jgi:hypothetical protein